MANTCIDYCNDDPMGAFEVLGCGSDPLGGFSAAVLFECLHDTVDYSNGAQVLADIAAGKAHLIERASFEIPAAAAVTQDSLVPCEGTRLVNYDRTVNYTNPNVTPVNVTTHDQVFSGRKFGALMLYNCAVEDGEPEYVTVIKNPLTAQGSFVGPRTNTEFQRFEGTFAYRSKKNPSRQLAPAGVFNQG